MRVGAVLMVYNEEELLPFFLSHYSYLDEIRVLYETDSSDGTLCLLRSASNVAIDHCHLDGLDDFEKVRLLNEAKERMDVEWVYVLDPDEFIFPPNGESPESFLSRQKESVVVSALYQVFRHGDEGDLDTKLPPVPQRTHGDPDILGDQMRPPNTAANFVYVKQNVLRTGRGLRLMCGSHRLRGDPETSKEGFFGAHWKMADPELAVRRRLDQKARMSSRNIALNLGWTNYSVTEEWIREECARHLLDPILPELATWRPT